MKFFLKNGERSRPGCCSLRLASNASRERHANRARRADGFGRAQRRVNDEASLTARGARALPKILTLDFE
jgi:hypothetical protein